MQRIEFNKKYDIYKLFIMCKFIYFIKKRSIIYKLLIKKIKINIRIFN